MAFTFLFICCCFHPAQTLIHSWAVSLGSPRAPVSIYLAHSSLINHLWRLSFVETLRSCSWSMTGEGKFILQPASLKKVCLEHSHTHFFTHCGCFCNKTAESKASGNYHPVAQTVKRLSTMRETQVRSLGWEDPLEKEMAIYSRTIAWKIPWTEEPGRVQSMGLQRVGHN